MNPIEKVRRLGQSIWLDYIHRNLITSGNLKKLVEDGLRGMTSNPTIFQKAITQGTDYDDALKAILKSNPSADVRTLYDYLTIEDIRMAADILCPVYNATDGLDGLVSLEPPPQLAYDTDGTIAEVDRIGFCEGGWCVQDNGGLAATDQLLIGLIYHTILRRRRRRATAAGGAA